MNANQDADRSAPDTAPPPEAPEDPQPRRQRQRVDVRRRLMALRRW
ncbi:hypothetical protein [Streptantibioticus ferralitis]|uniref:Uncharacterized protein n=1 Tax=Streptantibioticus ferralitis TaxID=236510 RepID=A0ABT5YXA8_9ACTN|nr:hypothetical protein [Streptantibioticus ferralitis]MDF2256195.1 hypothetical protein [Streptantibioticus ferralitis]